MNVLFIIAVFGMATFAYILGFMHGQDKRKKELSARVIRPTNITVEKKFNVTEYTVQDGALDIDFPNTSRGRL